MEECTITAPAKLRYMIELKLSDHVIDMLLQNPSQISFSLAKGGRSGIIAGPSGIERNVKITPAGRSSVPATECFERNGNQFQQVGLVIKKGVDNSEDLDSSLKNSLAEIRKEEHRKQSQQKTIGTGKAAASTGKRKRKSSVVPQPRKIPAWETSKAKQPTRVKPLIANLRIHLISILAKNEPISLSTIYDKSPDCPSRKILPILKQIGTTDTNDKWYLHIENITDEDLRHKDMSIEDRKELSALKRVQIKKEQEQERLREKEKRKQEREREKQKLARVQAAAAAKKKLPTPTRRSVAPLPVPEEDKAIHKLIVEYEKLKKEFDEQYHMYKERRNYVEGNARHARDLEKKWTAESDKRRKEVVAKDIALLHKDKCAKVAQQAMLCSKALPKLHDLREKLDSLSLKIVLTYQKEAETLQTEG